MRYNSIRKSTLFVICWLMSVLLYAQQTTGQVPDSVQPIIPLSTQVDSSLALDSSTVDSTKSSPISIPVVYAATDSITITGKGLAELFGDGSVTYGDLSIVSDYIRFTMDSSLVHAHGVADSSGTVMGKPKFKQGSEEYNADKMDYNLKTKKGFIENVTTQEGEGYITSTESKKDSSNVVCMRNGWYTTCDNHEHPDFYISMTKAKVRPGKDIVSGPAYLVVEGVPLPLFIPFGYFPSKSSYSSGVLMPSFGNEQSRGYYLQGGGYYWAMTQYNDLALRGDYYSNGSWALRAQSKYKLMYRFSGGLSVDYQVTLNSEKGLNDYSEAKDFKVVWNHSQDPKADPYSTFSAGVNFSTSSYNRNNVNSYYDPSLISQNHTYSSITYTKRWPESPWSLNSSMNASQNTSDSSLSVSLPQLSFAMSRIYPFKRKVSIGGQRWYEKLGVTYSGDLKNSITAKESEFMDKSIIKDWNNGVNHKLSTSTSFKMLNIFTVSPAINYNERWYSSSIRKDYNDSTNMVYVRDTVYGFHRAYDYAFSVGTSTTVYGFFRPITAINNLLFGGRFEAFRHVMTPSVSMSYRPDFGTPQYGYYQHYSTVTQDSTGFHSRDNTYSIYEGAIYGTPSSGQNGSISFSLGNIFDMKMRKKENASIASDAEVTDSEASGSDKSKEKDKYKKITLLESLSFTTSYNMLADSLNWSNIQMSGRTTLFKGLSITFGAVFDPYSYVVNPNGGYTRVNTPYWTSSGHTGIARMTSANMTTGYTISNDTFKRKKKEKKKETEGSGFGESKSNSSDNKEDETKDEYGYDLLKIPWNMTINYSVRWNSNPNSYDAEKKAFNLRMSQTLNFSGGFSLTPKWKFTFSSGYDFENNDLSYTSIGVSRDLHCWTLSGSIIPTGLYKSYNFTIAVSSSILQDLKWNQRSDPRSSSDF